MRVIVPNREQLDPAVAVALEAIAATINETSNVGHAADGRNLKTIFAAYHNTTQSIADSTFTPVNFNAQTDLRGVTGVKVPVGVHDNSVSPNKFIVPRGLAGRVLVRVRVAFAANVTGDRGIRLTKNDTVVQYGPLMKSSTASNSTILVAHFPVIANGGDVLGVDVYQTSGGALNIGSTDRTAQTDIEIEFP